MSTISFKEFTLFLESAEKSDDEFAQFLEEGFLSNLFGGSKENDNKSVEKYKHLLAHKDPRVSREAERGLSLLVKKGNEKAKALAAHNEKAKAAKDALEKAKLDYAKATTQAAETGSSQAWRNETGSLRRMRSA